jgi:hypothetical protein
MVVAVLLWIGAGAIWLSPFLFADFYLGLFASITDPPPTLPTWFYGVCGAIGAVAAWQGFVAFKTARPKKTQSEGSVILASVLLPLERQGWQIAYGAVVPGAGRLDALVRSPQGKTYLVDLKSHRGKIGTDGKTIFRVYTQSPRPFEADFLGQTKQKAVLVQKAKNWKTVVPVLMFPEARVEIKPNPIAGVYVVGAKTLRSCLLGLG